MLRLLGILALGKMIAGNNRRRESFPAGLFLLPALMFGGWIAVIALAGVFALFGTMIGGVFGGLDALAEGAFSVSGLVPGGEQDLIVMQHLRHPIYRDFLHIEPDYERVLDMLYEVNGKDME